MKPVLFLLLAAVSLGFSQKAVTPGRPTTPTIPTVPTTPTNPNTRNTNPFPTDQSQQTMDTARPIYLSGKVTLDDGTPPPDFVRIEKICGASPRPQGYTDSKGRFNFQLDGNIGVLADASDSTFGRQSPSAGNITGRNGERNLSGCDLRAVLPGFRSDTVNLSMHRAFDNPNIGTIVLHRIGGVEGTTISYASLNAPKDATRAFEKGREALKKEKQTEAEKQFRKAVELYPGFATAWYELGRLEEGRKQESEAQTDYRKAMEADPKFISPYLNLSNMAAQKADWAQTVELTDGAIKLNAVEFPQVFYLNALANLNLRHLDAAEKSARQAQKLDTRKVLARLGQLLGVILLEKQDYPGAALQMRAYLVANPQAKDATQVRAQLEQLDKLSPPPAGQR
jgi:tetratricopeptide (TPR) repeat protein